MADFEREILAKLEGYHRTVEHQAHVGTIAMSTAHTYLSRANLFVRWIIDDFDPGAGHTNPGENTLGHIREVIEARNP